jgi:hypothetical protein
MRCRIYSLFSSNLEIVVKLLREMKEEILSTLRREFAPIIDYCREQLVVTTWDVYYTLSWTVQERFKPLVQQLVRDFFNNPIECFSYKCQAPSHARQLVVSLLDGLVDLDSKNTALVGKRMPRVSLRRTIQSTTIMFTSFLFLKPF